jgi:hypothetical protein
VPLHWLGYGVAGCGLACWVIATVKNGLKWQFDGQAEYWAGAGLVLFLVGLGLAGELDG